MRMPKKTVIITGVGRGIGKATAEKFLAEGWQVVGTYHRTQPAEQAGLISIQMDLAKPESIAAAAEQIKNKISRVDALVNNSGIILDYEEKVILEKIRGTFEVNLFGLIDFTEKILPLISEGGHIVNVTSRYGSFSEMPIKESDVVGYRLSKASLNMYTRILAFMLRDKKINVSSIHPGWVSTDMGNKVASSTEKPDREPAEAAQDIFALATSNGPSGKFWFQGEEFGW
jgi:NAD(P)-dependent dehydrogenase (short-subunit alcohol dehydrogenase family)